MKPIAALCIVIACCFLQTATAIGRSPWPSAIANLKSRVNRGLSSLSRLERSTQFDLNNKLNNIHLNAMSSVNSAVNPALNSIRSSVDAAKNAGKDAENCYVTAKAELREVSMDGFDKLKQCKTSASSLVQPTLTDISSNTQAGNRILNDVNRIPLECQSSNAVQEGNCYTNKLATMSLSVKAFENAVRSIESTLSIAISKALSNATVCSSQITGSVSSKVSNARSAATKCIQNA
ncbi:uncharacterized protein [Prorops nasuta]|uniref:uncharacterized protein n=1 Tax=Prorops nasuta TaxID=863751 RepID=UPI0034CFEB47